MEKVDKTINFLGGRKSLIMWLILIYVLVGYNYQIRSWYNDNIIPTLDLFKPNTWILGITWFIVIVFLCHIYCMYQQFDITGKCRKQHLNT